MNTKPHNAVTMVFKTAHTVNQLFKHSQLQTSRGPLAYMPCGSSPQCVKVFRFRSPYSSSVYKGDGGQWSTFLLRSRPSLQDCNSIFNYVVFIFGWITKIQQHFLSLHDLWEELSNLNLLVQWTTFNKLKSSLSVLFPPQWTTLVHLLYATGLKHPKSSYTVLKYSPSKQGFFEGLNNVPGTQFRSWSLRRKRNSSLLRFLLDLG